MNKKVKPADAAEEMVHVMMTPLRVTGEIMALSFQILASIWGNQAIINAHWTK